MLTLPHGAVRTPVFMPVGTQATVKGLTPVEIAALGAEIVLANTYHLYLRPGLSWSPRSAACTRSWRGTAVLTDSGGFQVFSLGFGREHGVGKIAKIFPAQASGNQVPSRGAGIRVSDAEPGSQPPGAEEPGTTSMESSGSSRRSRSRANNPPAKGHRD